MPKSSFLRPLLLLPQDMNEKGELPAIVITPASPSTTEFHVHFVPPPRRRFSLAAMFRSRGAIALPSTPGPTSISSQRRTRTFVLLLIPLFIIIAHVLLHELARPDTDPSPLLAWLAGVWAAPAGPGATPAAITFDYAAEAPSRQPRLRSPPSELPSTHPL